MKLTDAKKIVQQMEIAYSNQRPIDRDLTTYIDPTRGVYMNQANITFKMDGQTLVDTTPLEAVEAYSSGFMSYMTDPARQEWFRIQLDGTEQQNEDASIFLADLSDLIRKVLSGSNIYQELLNVYGEHGVFGRGVMLVVHDDQTIARAFFYTAGSYYLQKGANGEIDHFAVKVMKNACQLVEEFGYYNVPISVKTAFDAKNDQYFTLVHLICPNKNQDTDYKDYRGMAYMSLKWLESSQADDYLSVSGFRVFPLVCARYYPKDQNQIYGGKYPGYGALSASKQLQAQVRAGNLTDAFNAEPSLINYGSVNIDRVYPGAVIDFDLGNAKASGNKYGLEPIFPYRDTSYLEAKSDRQRRAINHWFLVDFFQLLSQIPDKSMTLGEVNMRYSEMVKSISPQIMSIESALRQLLDIVLHIITENYVISQGSNMSILEYFCGPVPSAVKDANINYEFVGVLSILQKASETAPDEQLIQFATYLTSSAQDQINPAMDWVNPDLILTKYAGRIGRSSELRTKDQVDQIRAKREQAMSAQQMQNEAQNSINAAQTLSNTPIANNSALAAVMGQQQR